LRTRFDLNYLCAFVNWKLIQKAINEWFDSWLSWHSERNHQNLEYKRGPENSTKRYYWFWIKKTYSSLCGFDTKNIVIFFFSTLNESICALSLFEFWISYFSLLSCILLKRWSLVSFLIYRNDVIFKKLNSVANFFLLNFSFKLRFLTNNQISNIKNFITEFVVSDLFNRLINTSDNHFINFDKNFL